MPDVKSMCETDWCGVDLVNNSPTKKATILTAGEILPGLDQQPRLVLPIEMDGVHKKYSPNKTSLVHLSKVWGTDTEKWSGKDITLVVESISGRNAVIARPVV